MNGNKNYFKRNLKGFIILGAIILLAVIPSLTGNKKAPEHEFNPRETEFLSRFMNSDKDFNMNKIPQKEYVAKLHVTGVIQPDGDTYSQKWMTKTIETLKNDKNNKGIILFIDSPGGTVYEADETYLALKEYRKETERPVYAYFSHIAASGGYYIACSADYIMANRNTITGSIGVISGQFVDMTGLMEKAGIKSQTIHSGKNKIMGHITEPATDEQLAIMQSICDECYDQFVGIVSEARNLGDEATRKLADGRPYTAKQAKENGLIDGIGSLDELKKTMSEKEFEGDEFETADFAYIKKESIYSMMMGQAKNLRKILASPLLPEAVEKAVTPEVPFPAYM